MMRTIECQLLAMPAPIRSLLLQQAVYRPQPVLVARRLLSTATSSSIHTSQPTTTSPPPPSTPLSFLPPPSNDPHGVPIPAPEVPPSVLASTTALLTTPPPRFLYSAPRFLNLPFNTRVPEICLLGRSNVGKSTLINALAGIASSQAGRSHGSTVSTSSRSSSSTPKGLAITSTKAGCTRTLNGYGFGAPPPSPSPTPPPLPSQPTPTRSLRRHLAAHLRTVDPPPPAALVLTDMPGYGHSSRHAWGAEIAKYLARRGALRGAVLLVDAVAGVKAGDRAALALLRDAGVRTAVVLTKADKLGYGGGGGGGRHESGGGGEGEKAKGAAAARVARVCEQVWAVLREVEGQGRRPGGSGGWAEGRGWEREVWVTGAGDPRQGGGVGFGVEGARFAIARMAGLVADERVLEGVAARQKAAPSRIVPFEELQWAPTHASV